MEALKNIGILVSIALSVGAIVYNYATRNNDIKHIVADIERLDRKHDTCGGGPAITENTRKIDALHRRLDETSTILHYIKGKIDNA